MGYSVSVHAKDIPSLYKMWDFMQKFYTKPTTLFGRKDCYSRLATNFGKGARLYGLSYDHSRSAIGFDYNACGLERDYIFQVVGWMTLKIGKTKTIRNVGEVPYYVYDGHEKSLIFVESIWGDRIPKKYKYAAVNDVGFKSLASEYVGVPAYEKESNKQAWLEERLSAYSKLYGISWQEIDEKIHNELIRLDTEYINRIKK
jgi:hypothetical protein